MIAVNRAVRIATALVFVAVAAPIWGSQQASAQNQGGFAISPPTAELSGNPGQTVTAKFDIYNNADQPQEFAAEFSNFTAGGAEGDQPVFTNDSTGFEMSSWMKVSPSKAVIPPNGGSISVDLSIAIPRDAAPGGHYGAFTVHPASLPQTGEVTVDPALSALILVNVSGAQTEKISIAGFSAQTGTGMNALRQEKLLFTEGPLDFAVNLRNDGNIATRPTIVVFVRDTFNKRVAELKVESPGNVLPRSNRIYRAHWDEAAPLGRYSAEVNVTYGKDSQALAAKTSFNAAPPWFIALLAAAVLLILLLIVRKSFNKWRAKHKPKKKKRKIKKIIYEDDEDENSGSDEK